MKRSGNFLITAIHSFFKTQPVHLFQGTLCRTFKIGYSLQDDTLLSGQVVMGVYVHYLFAGLNRSCIADSHGNQCEAA